MIAAIVNPHSASGRTGKQWPEIEQQIEAKGLEITAHFTQGVGDGIELTRKALKSGATQIVAVGGDGTLNEVINGFFEDDELINPEACLSIIMRGTGGDFRKTLGIKNTLDSYLHHLAEGEIHAIDIGKITHGENQVRYFCNVASAGMGGAVVDTIEQSPRMKSMGGKAGFISATMVTMARFTPQKVAMTLDQQHTITTAMRQIAVSNARFQGGGMQVAPMADVQDGLLDIILLEGVGRLRSLLAFGKVYRGHHLNTSCIHHYKAQHIELHPLEEQPILMDIDGEGPIHLPATIEILPGVLRMKY